MTQHTADAMPSMAAMPEKTGSIVIAENVAFQASVLNG
jgi:hypothetical protein